MNLIDFFDAGVADHPDAPCFVDSGRDAQTITYAQAGALTCQIANALQALGLEPGFHGAVLSGNAGAAFTALLAVVRAQGVWLPVNARNSVETNIEFLEDMDCDVLFYQARYADQVNEIRNRVPHIRHYISLDEAGEKNLSVSSLIQGQSAALFSPPLQPQAVAMIMSTGGTTGQLAPQHTVIAYSDNSSVMESGVIERLIGEKLHAGSLLLLLAHGNPGVGDQHVSARNSLRHVRGDQDGAAG